MEPNSLSVMRSSLYPKTLPITFQSTRSFRKQWIPSSDSGKKKAAPPNLFLERDHERETDTQDRSIKKTLLVQNPRNPKEAKG